MKCQVAWPVRDPPPMSPTDHDWWRCPPPSDELPADHRRGYGPNVQWRELTEAERAAMWRLIIPVCVVLAIIGALFG